MPPYTTQAPALARKPPDLVSAQGIARVDADADHVAGGDGGRVELLERFVGDERVAVFSRCRCRQHIEPAGGYDGHAERHVARIDQVYAHDLKTN